MVAVGTAAGDVHLYHLHPPPVTSGHAALQGAPAPGMLIRTLELEDWGHPAAALGAVSALAWAPDCRALAVGHAKQGMVVWSPSGCRLLCTLRQGSSGAPGRVEAALDVRCQSRQEEGSGVGSSGLQGDGLQSGVLQSSTQHDRTTYSNRAQSSGSSGSSGSPSSSAHGTQASVHHAQGQQAPRAPAPAVLDGGVVALTWGPLGYQLMVAEAGPGGRLVELQLAKSLPGHHRVAHAQGAGGAAKGAVHVGGELHALQVGARMSWVVCDACFVEVCFGGFTLQGCAALLSIVEFQASLITWRGRYPPGHKLVCSLSCSSSSL